jgi:hypothetical protein
MMQKQLFVVIVMLFSVLSCKIDRNKSVDRDKFTYKYTDDSFLFFKNVRQIYYDFEDLPKARWYAYRWADRNQQSDVPTLNPVIVVDWFKGEAYVLIEPNELLFNEESLMIREKNPQTGKTYSYSLKERGRENMLEFATKIYEGIMVGGELFIQYKREFVPLFSSEEQSESFRIVMSDYYRLTNVFGK